MQISTRVSGACGRGTGMQATLCVQCECMRIVDWRGDDMQGPKHQQGKMWIQSKNGNKRIYQHQCGCHVQYVVQQLLITWSPYWLALVSSQWGWNREVITTGFSKIVIHCNHKTSSRIHKCAQTILGWWVQRYVRLAADRYTQGQTQPNAFSPSSHLVRLIKMI